MLAVNFRYMQALSCLMAQATNNKYLNLIYCIQWAGNLKILYYSNIISLKDKNKTYTII